MTETKETLKKLVDDEKITVAFDPATRELIVYVLTDITHADCVIAGRMAQWHPVHKLIVSLLNDGELGMVDDDVKIADNGEVYYTGALRFRTDECRGCSGTCCTGVGSDSCTCN